MDAQEESRTQNRAIWDFVGGLTPDKRGHGMTDVFCNADPEPKSLGQIRGE